MATLKMNQRVPNKNADLLKKVSLMGTKVRSMYHLGKGKTAQG